LNDGHRHQGQLQRRRAHSAAHGKALGEVARTLYLLGKSAKATQQNYNQLYSQYAERIAEI